MSNVQRVVITHSKFTDNGYRPFHGHASILDSEFSFNYCSDNGKGFTGEVEGPYDGIFFFDGARNLIITGNRIITSNTVGCIVVGGVISGSSGSSEITISNNVCQSKTPTEANGIVLIGITLMSVTITGNTIYNCRHSILASNDYASIGEGITICGNVIEENVVGIYILATLSKSSVSGNIIRKCSEGGITATGLSDSNISNNAFIDNGPSTPGKDAINLTTCVRNIISSNNFVNTAAGTRQQYGVRETTGCDSNLIIANQFRQMVLGAHLLIGVNSVAKDNMIEGVYTA